MRRFGIALLALLIAGGIAGAVIFFAPDLVSSFQGEDTAKQDSEEAEEDTETRSPAEPSKTSTWARDRREQLRQEAGEE